MDCDLAAFYILALAVLSLPSSLTLCLISTVYLYVQLSFLSCHLPVPCNFRVLCHHLYPPVLWRDTCLCLQCWCGIGCAMLPCLYLFCCCFKLMPPYLSLYSSLLPTFLYFIFVAALAFSYVTYLVRGVDVWALQQATYLLAAWFSINDMSLRTFTCLLPTTPTYHIPGRNNVPEHWLRCRNEHARERRYTPTMTPMLFMNAHCLILLRACDF